MTKTEAIEAMKNGEKVTHTRFTSDEWMTIGIDGFIYLEDGVNCPINSFFMHRKDESWDDGYSIYNT